MRLVIFISAIIIADRIKHVNDIVFVSFTVIGAILFMMLDYREFMRNQNREEN